MLSKGTEKEGSAHTHPSAFTSPFNFLGVTFGPPGLLRAMIIGNTAVLGYVRPLCPEFGRSLAPLCSRYNYPNTHPDPLQNPRM